MSRIALLLLVVTSAMVAGAGCTVVKVDCIEDSDCDGRELCVDNECIECQRDRDCDDDEECDDGACVTPGAEGEGEAGEGEGEGGEGEGEGEPVIRRGCTNSFGDAITPGSGRLDGVLVSIVEPHANGCRGDDNHVHLQVEADGRVYDVSINVRSEFNEDDRVSMATVPLASLPGPPFDPGWHAGEVASYRFDLGVSSDQFTPFELDPLADQITLAVADAGRISVFMVGFEDGTGGHKVHKNGTGTDGFLIVDPTGTPTAVAFRFSDQFF